MKLLCIQTCSLGLVLGLPSDPFKRDPKHYSDNWGETHKRDSAEQEGEKAPFIVLPSTSNKNVFSLTDLPENNDWGLVEVDRDFDLIADEYSDKSDNFVYTQTENPVEFQPSSRDPWKGVPASSTQPPSYLSGKIFEPFQDLDFSWSPTKGFDAKAKVVAVDNKLSAKVDNVHDTPIDNSVIDNSDLKAEHRADPPSDRSSVTNVGSVYTPPPPQISVALPLIDSNNVSPDSTLQHQQPREPLYNVQGRNRPVAAPFPKVAHPYAPTSQQGVKRPAQPPPGFERAGHKTIVQQPAPRLPQPLQNSHPVLPVHPPVSQNVQPLQPQHQTDNLSKNPLTRLKQQLKLPNPADAPLPSLNKIRENIKSVLPSLPTIPSAPPRTGSSSGGFKIPTIFGTIAPSILSPQSNEPGLLHSITDGLVNIMSQTSSSKANSASYSQPSNSYSEVTEKTPPLPVPTYLPISKTSEFSAGFQILVQYIAAMVGIALILAI